jgi:hypothetical protein
MGPVCQSNMKKTCCLEFARCRISGRWLESDWPIVVGAYRRGEPVGAIALDQELLRRGETEFELWIPSGPFELRGTSACRRRRDRSGAG